VGAETLISVNCKQRRMAKVKNGTSKDFAIKKKGKSNEQTR